MPSTTHDAALSGPWWSTDDPVRIARVELGAVLAALLLGVQLALVLQAGLLGSDSLALIGADALGGSIGAYSLITIFLFALPALPLVIGTLTLPSMVGAERFASPKLNTATLQLHLVAGGLIVVALLGGSIDHSVRHLPAAVAGTPSWSLAIASLGLHLLGLALVCNALNTLATAIYGRSTSSRPADWPILAWGLVTGAAVQVAVAVAVAALGLLLLLAGVALVGGSAYYKANREQVLATWERFLGRFEGWE